MTKKEKEEFKKEIIAEILKELKGKNKISESQYDFEKYRIDVVNDDLNKIDDFIKRGKRWTWFIPLIGIYIYGYQATQMLNSMDRGAMRVAITKYQTRNTAWYILLWSICLPMIINVQPFVDWHIYKNAAKEVRHNLETMKNKL